MMGQQISESFYFLRDYQKNYIRFSDFSDWHERFESFQVRELEFCKTRQTAALSGSGHLLLRKIQ